MVKKTQSLYLTWACIGTGSQQTGGRADRITIASTRLALRAVARKNCSDSIHVWCFAGFMALCWQ